MACLLTYKNYAPLLVILTSIIILSACAENSVYKPAPVAEKGILDLSRWNLAQDGPVDLVGEWEFYWKEHIEPEAFSRVVPPEKTGYFHMPDYWNDHVVNGKPLTGNGYATFRLKILMGDQKGGFAFKFLDMTSAFSFRVNGKLVNATGVVGKLPIQTVPRSSPEVSSLFSETDQLEIVLQMSNYHHRSGGPWEAIRFGREKDVWSLREKQVVTAIFLFGSIFIIGIYHLGLFMLRKNEMPSLYFGLLCIIMVLRVLVTGEKYLVQLIPAITWEILFKIEYLSFYLGVPVFFMFIHTIFYREFSKWVLRGYQIAGTVFTGVVLFLPAKNFSHTVQAYQLITILGCMYTIYVLILSANRKREGSVIFLLGFLILFLTVLNDILYANALVTTGYFAPFGLFCFIFSQSSLLSRRFVKAVTTIEIQSEALMDANTAYQREISERKRTQEELKTYHEKLKDLVTERTKVLTQTNQQLEEEIAERKYSERALQESKALFDSFMRYLPALTFMKDRDGCYIYLNEACLKFYRVTAEERIGKTDYELFPDDIARQLVENDRKVMLEAQVLNAVEKVTIENKTHYHLVSKFPIVKDGEPLILAGIALDITDRIEAEEEKARLEVQLQRSQKMEALGLLAGGVAHDLNNVLSGIVSYPELILMDLPENSPFRKPVLTIQKSGQKAAEIVQDLLTLARRGVMHTVVLNLNDVISEYLESPEHERLTAYHSSVHLEPRLAEDLLNIRCSPIHLKKTIMNLLSNAAEAQPKGGKIIISTESRYVDRPIKGYNDVEEGDYTVLKVEDHGAGIASEDMKRIFEPFYTKKVMGRSGTGLGMAVVWGTVQDHKGYIHVESTGGEGTRFELYFPATRDAIPVVHDSISMETYMGAGESVLIIDDVAEQREIASKILVKLGYNVTAVSSGEEAVVYLKDRSVDVLILDMIIDPGMDGLETFKKISAIHPEQKAVIASGFSETEKVKEAQRLGAGIYIKKPYTIEKIGLAVKRELEK